MNSFGLSDKLDFFPLLQVKKILDIASIPSRWLRLTETRSSRQVDSSPVCTPRQVNVQKRSSVRRPMVGSDRYRKAKEVTDELADLIANTGGNQYLSRMEVVKAIKTFWTSKRECVLLPISADGVVDGQYLFLL